MAITRHSALYPGVHASGASVWAAMTRIAFVDNAGTTPASAVVGVTDGANVLIKFCTFTGRFQPGQPRGAAHLVNRGGEVWAEDTTGAWVVPDGSDAIELASDMPDTTKFTNDEDPRVLSIREVCALPR